MTKPLLDYSDYYLRQLSENFCKELHVAFEGEKSSLAFLKHSLPAKPYINASNKKFQVMSIGGSNLETSIIDASAPDTLAEIVSINISQMNKAADLIDTISPHVHDDIEWLFVNFAYPLKPINRQNKLDGELVKPTKEHAFHGLIGELVGEFIEVELSKIKNRPIQVVIFNDVVGLALSALSRPEASANHLISMVLGTGNNTGLFIDESTVVNIESGNFNGFMPTRSQLAIQNSSNVSGQFFEQAVAGKYLYQHANYYAHKSNLNIDFKETIEVNQMAEANLPARYICRHVMFRSAALIAAMLTGIWLYKNKQPLLCPVEGSIFWKSYQYSSSVNYWLQHLGVPENGITFTRIDHSNLRAGITIALFETYRNASL